MFLCITHNIIYHITNSNHTVPCSCARKSSLVTCKISLMLTVNRVSLSRKLRLKFMRTLLQVNPFSRWPEPCLSSMETRLQAHAKAVKSPCETCFKPSICVHANTSQHRHETGATFMQTLCETNFDYRSYKPCFKFTPNPLQVHVKPASIPIETR